RIGVRCALATNQTAAHQCDPKDANDCEAQCSKSDMPSCHNLALAFDSGTGGVAKDRDKAIAAAENACSGGLGKSCAFAGTRRKAAGDAANANTLFQRGCRDLGDGESCYWLGHSLKSKGDESAIRTLQRSCDLGNSPACTY